MDIVEQLKNELKKPKPIPVIDLAHFIEIQKRKPKYKIGLIGKCPQNFSGYKEGDIVLFEPYKVERAVYRMESKEIESYIKHCSVCVPSPWYFNGKSKIDTIRSCVGFPLEYIQYEIKLN